MENRFSFQHLKTLNLDSGKEYIKQFFIPLTNGNHVFIKGSDYEILDTATVKKVYFNRIHKDLNKFYFFEYDEIREPVCDVGRPFLFDNKINLIDVFKHETKPYNDYSDDIKANVVRVLNVIKEVWANNNEETFKYIIGWFASVIRGEKTGKILYLKGPQGIGKSTITEFIANKVIGKLALITGSEPLKSQFNISLMGKLLVVFEELENFNTNEWTVISSRLKRYSTAYNTQYEAKGKDVITAQDLNNMIVLSNNDAVRDDDGRRYVILDLSLKYKGQIDFWNKLYTECLNDTVGEAFYNYLLEYDLTDFDLEQTPHTKSKSDAIVKRIEMVGQFIKEEYVLQCKGIKSTVSELFDLFVSYCGNKNSKHYHKIDFNKKLKEYGINYYKSNSKNIYNVPYENLLKIANNNKWIHELDEFQNNNNEKIMNDLDYGIPNDEINELKKQLEELKEKHTKEINELKRNIKNQNNVIEDFIHEIDSTIQAEQIDDIDNEINRIVHLKRQFRRIGKSESVYKVDPSHGHCDREADEHEYHQDIDEKRACEKEYNDELERLMKLKNHIIGVVEEVDKEEDIITIVDTSALDLF